MSENTKTDLTLQKPEIKRGRPPFYATPEELQTQIDAYFLTCRPTQIINDKGEPVFDLAGQPILENNPPTLTGMALFLGFCNRTSMYDYEERNAAFSDTIKKARSRIEEGAEKDLFRKAKPTGPIFWLKNMGGDWNAEERKDISSKITINDLSKLPQDVLVAAAASAGLEANREDTGGAQDEPEHAAD